MICDDCAEAGTTRSRSMPHISAAIEHSGAPTVILAKTVKGWALGPDIEARNATHQIKKMTEAELRTFRDRLDLPISDTQLAQELPPYAHPGPDSVGVRVPHTASAAARRPGPSTRRAARGRSTSRTTIRTATYWPVPAKGSWRRPRAPSPDCCATCSRPAASGRGSSRSSRTRPARSASTGCFARSRSTPPVASSTSPSTPGCCSATRKPRTARSSRRASPRRDRWRRSSRPPHRTATWGEPMIPFFVYYSMFGFHRFGDLVWAAGDMRARGFLLGSHRRTDDPPGRGPAALRRPQPALRQCHSQLAAYDPAFAYEVAVIVATGSRACTALTPKTSFTT